MAKKITALLASLTLVFTLSGCYQQPVEIPTEESETPAVINENALEGVIENENAEPVVDQEAETVNENAIAE